MNWMSLLGKIGLGVAAPFTGGASLLAMPAVDALTAGIGGAGAGASAASGAKASNRGTKFEAQTDLEKMLMDRDKQYQDMSISREQEGRAGTQDAYRKLQGAQHLLSPGARPQLSPYSVAPRMATDMERGGADALSQQVLARLQGGNPIASIAPRQITNNDAGFRVDPSLLDPSKSEKILGWLGAGLNTYAGMRKPQTKPVSDGI